MSDLGNKEIFSRNLKYYMNLNNKNRNDICNALGFKYTTFTSWYNGDFYPRIDKIEMLANYFGIEKSDLIEEHNNNSSEFDVDFKICGERLTKLRNDFNYTLEDVSKKTGISTRLLKRYEKGIVEKMKQSTISILADLYNVNPVWLMGLDTHMKVIPLNNIEKIKIPLLGKVKAGYNYLVQENIIGYESIDNVSDKENYYALQITGDSMEPLFSNGDIAIVHKQDDFESGNTCIVLINGDEATVKKVVRMEDGIDLIAMNPYYPVRHFSSEDMKKIPVKIIGKVVEARKRNQFK
jgi:repressor LexA